MKIGFSSARTFTSLEERPMAKRGIGLAVGHLEPDHGAAVLLLERLHLAAGLDHDDGERPAVELGAALEDGVDEAVGLVEGDGGHRSLRFG